MTLKEIDDFVRIEQGFTHKEEDNIIAILKIIDENLTGDMCHRHSGGGHMHLSAQLKDKKWLTFHCMSGDITISSKPYENSDTFMDAAWDEQEEVYAIELDQKGTKTVLDTVELILKHTS